MYIGIGTLLIIVWFIGGVIYREKLFFEAALFRGNQYNELVKVIEEEFGSGEHRKLLDLSSLERGIYLCRFRCATGGKVTEMTRKLVLD